MLAFISSNKWFRAAYGSKLREHIAEMCWVSSITDFGELPVFQSASTFPMIFIAQKEVKERESTIFTQVQSLKRPYPDIPMLIERHGKELSDGSVSGPNWSLTDRETAERLSKMESSSIPLGEYVEGKFYYGIKTGCNKAFVIDGEQRMRLIAEDSRSEEIIRPLFIGDDIRKWRSDFSDRWIITTKIGIDIRKYPAVLQHLKKWETELQERWDKGEQWWELRPCSYYDKFLKTKIIFPDIAKESRFTLDRRGSYVLNTAYFTPVDDLFLLGVLNSDAVWSFVQANFSSLGDPYKGGRIRFFLQSVSRIPIPKATDTDKNTISALVRNCLKSNGRGREEWEQEIERYVEAIYGL